MKKSEIVGKDSPKASASMKRVLDVNQPGRAFKELQRELSAPKSKKRKK